MASHLASAVIAVALLSATMAAAQTSGPGATLSINMGRYSPCGQACFPPSGLTFTTSFTDDEAVLFCNRFQSVSSAISDCSFNCPLRDPSFGATNQVVFTCSDIRFGRLTPVASPAAPSPSPSPSPPSSPSPSPPPPPPPQPSAPPQPSPSDSPSEPAASASTAAATSSTAPTSSAPSSTVASGNGQSGSTVTSPSVAGLASSASTSERTTSRITSATIASSTGSTSPSSSATVTDSQASQNSSDNGGSSGPSIPLIAGIAAGALLLICAIIAGILWYRNSQAKKSQVADVGFGGSSFSNTGPAINNPQMFSNKPYVPEPTMISVPAPAVLHPTPTPTTFSTVTASSSAAGSHYGSSAGPMPEKGSGLFANVSTSQPDSGPAHPLIEKQMLAKHGYRADSSAEEAEPVPGYSVMAAGPSSSSSSTYVVPAPAPVMPMMQPQMYQPQQPQQPNFYGQQQQPPFVSQLQPMFYPQQQQQQPQQAYGYPAPGQPQYYQG
ncbi:hypothetical protein HDU96_003878 [Phlyctochytrium bullatum]|nr:hypothetical protein HDU96_003878 [Phlyctochytrium bullatum]